MTPVKVIKSITTQKAIYQAELIKCGKKNCTKCPHGPYWYAYIRKKGKVKDDGKRESGSVKVVYIGKDFKFLKGDNGKIVTDHRV